MPITKKEINIKTKIIVAGILFITFFCYTPTFNNSFTNWDDEVYVTKNELITDLSSKTISKIFKPETEVGMNYHPLTVLSLALNYHYSKLSPKPYFITNVIIHLFNTLLVFLFIYKLTNKRLQIASLVSVWFGVHPMHVESVSWISERKDVLYTFFFLLAAISYLRYLEEGKIKGIFFVFSLFICSCLSKAMALSFVPVMFLLDYIQKREYNYKAVLEKIPFIVVAVLIGYNAVIIQNKVAIKDFEEYTFVQHILFASYGFVNYLVKLFLPFNLSAYYPYPIINNQTNLPFIYYLMPVIAICIILFPVLYTLKFNRKYFRMVIFGLVFYFFTIAMVLQFVQVGSAIMADRYSYIPYIGIFFILASILDEYAEKRQLIFFLISFITILISLYISSQREKVWKNSETLWTEVIEKYPLRFPVAYKSRASYYIQMGQFNNAYEDILCEIKMNDKDVDAYQDYANICGMRKEYEMALSAYNKALELKKTDNGNIYFNRAINYARVNEFDKALSDFEIAAKQKFDSTALCINRSMVYYETKNYDKAILDYDFLIKKFPKDKTYYFYRGLSNFNLFKDNMAIVDFNKSLQFDPDFKEAYFNLFLIYLRQKQYEKALDYAVKTKALGYEIPDIYMEKLKNNIHVSS